MRVDVAYGLLILLLAVGLFVGIQVRRRQHRRRGSHRIHLNLSRLSGHELPRPAAEDDFERRR